MSRAGRRVVAGVTFRLGPGEALQLTGPNGAGKSTLLRALAGLLPLAAGRLVLTSSGGADGGPVAENVHFIGHIEGLKAALTAGENLAFAAAVAGTPGIAPDRALERLGIGHLASLPVAYCSAGQRRRVALARLLAARRPVWLLDEPATALDQAGQAVLAALLADHRAAGGLVIAATHGPVGLAAPLHELDLRP